MKINILDDTRFQDYVKAKEFFTYAPGRITCGRFEVWDGSQWISHQEFDRLYKPVLRPTVSSLENPCNKRKFML